MTQTASQESQEQPQQEPHQDPLLFRFFTEIGIIEQLSRNAFERIMPHGLKISQFSVLNHFVRLGGPRSPLDLARSFQVSKGAMTNTLQKLEAKGFVTVEPDPVDGRAKLVDITEAGRKAREDAVAAAAPLMNEIQALVRDVDIDALLPELTRIRELLDAQRDG